MIAKVKFQKKILNFYLERHSDFAAFYQVFVSKSYPNLMVKIQKGDVVIDAGANIGVFTIIASTLTGTNGKIIAIEPDPGNIKILKNNIKLNNLKNVEIIDKALYRESGKKIKFNLNDVKIITDKKEEGTKNIEVETTTFDDIITQRAIQPHVLKMDIEGAEKFALLSAENTMKTLNYFEGEIHSREDFDVLMNFSSLFSFKREPIESMHNVFSFSIKHPLKILKLEFYNKFRTTRRVILSSVHHSRPSEYPIIIVGERLFQ
ncbi:MAG: FkbM family methyltransferase [Nitrososphaerota archaeon]|jgi:FkbM family methyltransferase|nr:FkbM family methyltransferase [Nitrososphaerota archaeon]MDG7038097.1 FkbM family methyltransferase [Nitrososphaerota archaeon]